MIVYLITNQINGKRYVGQTIQTMGARWSRHCSLSKANSGMPIVHAIQKYEKCNFIKEVLIECQSIEEMNYWEKYYIEQFNTLTPNGYNVLPGGLNSLHTEETKKKIADAQRGNKNHNFGKIASLETKNKMSIGHIGLKRSEDVRKACSERVSGGKHPMFGKCHTEESRNKISKSLKGLNTWTLGTKVSAETKRKISEAQMGKSPSIETRNKLAKAHSGVSVEIYCPQTETTYRSLNQASISLSIDRCKIKDILRGKRNHTKGYTFLYVKGGTK
jgi:hypothetical protein